MDDKIRLVERLTMTDPEIYGPYLEHIKNRVPEGPWQEEIDVFLRLKIEDEGKEENAEIILPIPLYTEGKGAVLGHIINFDVKSCRGYAGGAKFKATVLFRCSLCALLAKTDRMNLPIWILKSNGASYFYFSGMVRKAEYYIRRIIGKKDGFLYQHPHGGIKVPSREKAEKAIEIMRGLISEEGWKKWTWRQAPVP